MNGDFVGHDVAIEDNNTSIDVAIANWKNR